MILPGLHALSWAVCLTALLASVWADLKDRIIPNEYVGVVAASGISITLLFRPEQAPYSLLAAALVLFGLGLLSHFNLMGGGDVKLISATVLMVPPGDAGRLLITIALAGGLLSCIYLAARLALRGRSVPKSSAAVEAGRNSGGWFSNECARVAGGGPMPYALAILGGVAGYIAGELVRCLSVGSCLS
jgi:prepilin peptidase CpaA